jgi:hypothetical protein
MQIVQSSKDITETLVAVGIVAASVAVALLVKN